MTGELTPIYGMAGFFQIHVTPPSGASRNVTFFRGMPTKINSMSSADPFGDATMSITFPAITGLDRPGSGDLDWMVPWADVDVWAYDETGLNTGWSWEGFFVSESINEDGLTISCKGALYQGDNNLATPRFLQRPMAYEHLIRDTFDPQLHPGLRTSPLLVEWPEGWNIRAPHTATDVESDPEWFLRPWGVTPGSRWTGLTTRSTGSWEPSVTGYVQTLLSVMYTADGGQWTITHRRGRTPVLHVRPQMVRPDETTFVVQYGAPGVTVNVSRDFSQSANVVYATGQDLAGTAFSGQQVTNDGLSTYYEPFAALPYVYPIGRSNSRYLPSIMRKETFLQIPQGIDQNAARDVAAAHLRRFADPGYVGTIELKIDPLLGDLPFPRELMKAGRSILVKGFRGADIMFHISQASINFDSSSVSLTVDSKFRDALTIHEVTARTRDALDPVRMLQTGKYSATVQDLIKPWSYSDGSGVIPSGGELDATDLFIQLMPTNEQFPWTNTTTKYPPKDYPSYYIRVPKSTWTTPDGYHPGWSGLDRDGRTQLAVPVRMSQSGSIRLTQIAAYDKDGNVLKIPFHVGIYVNSGTSPVDMPMVPAPGWDGHPAGYRSPFFPGAFEQIKPSGERQTDMVYLVAEGAGQVVAWGNYYEPAGYSPGLYSQGAAVTGLLIDEQSWSYTASTAAGEIDIYSIENTANNPAAGLMYVLVYCEPQYEDVYFLGRLWRVEPGGQ